ncbi:MAG: glutathione peroxidase [Pseudomonadota bacterium]
MRDFTIALSLGLLAACSAASSDTVSAQNIQTTEERTMADAHAISFDTITGDPLALSDFTGKAVLVVNTASRCGYTPQYAGLQELYETFEPQGLVVLGAPSNDFGGQEPGTEADVKEFCEINYGVTFPLTSKVSAAGANVHPFWQAAVSALGEQAQPKWNFHKVLVGPDGTFLKAYPSAVKPADAELVADIEAALAG